MLCYFKKFYTYLEIKQHSPEVPISQRRNPNGNLNKIEYYEKLYWNLWDTAGRVDQVVKHLPRQNKVLSSAFSAIHK
jgi:hypothetical protein